MERLLLVALGGLASLLLLEAGLQLAARVWTAGSRSVSIPAPASENVVRVLCLGDSNTYGLGLEPQESYPAQLEALWAERVGSPRLEVYNLGFPGTNSSRLVRDLPDLLDRLAPDVILLMVGVNDYWTRELAVEEPGDASVWQQMARHSRVRRLYWLLRARLEPPPSFTRDPRPFPAEGPRRMAVGGRSFDVDFERAEPGEHGNSASLRANLLRLVELGRERGAEVVLISYPAWSSFYPHASRVIQRAAALAKTPFVDVATVFHSRCREQTCPELLFADGHPNAAGYGVVAETLVQELDPRYGR
jgi:lysophospholipase L1-like esterase